MNKHNDSAVSNHLILPRLVYIAGRGYSGSTILDILLGNAPNTTSVGELLSGFLGPRPCGCGSAFRECDFWRNIRDRVGRECTGTGWDRLLEISARFGRVSKFPRVAMSTSTQRLSGDLVLYRKATVDLYQAISDVSGTNIIVESSKEITRATFLAGWYPDSKILHLVKNPMSVLASYRWRLESGEPFKFLRHKVDNIWVTWPFLLLSALSWLVGNLLVEFIRWNHPQKVMRVRYEDLCNRPEDTLNSIGRFTGINVEPVIEEFHESNNFYIGHNVSGNRISRLNSISFEPSTEHETLGPIIRGVALILTYPLRKFYGY